MARRRSRSAGRTPASPASSLNLGASMRFRWSALARQRSEPRRKRVHLMGRRRQAKCAGLDRPLAVHDRFQLLELPVRQESEVPQTGALPRWESFRSSGPCAGCPTTWSGPDPFAGDPPRAGSRLPCRDRRPRKTLKARWDLRVRVSLLPSVSRYRRRPCSGRKKAGGEGIGPHLGEIRRRVGSANGATALQCRTRHGQTRVRS